jgi:hypothetical protein
VTVNGNGPYLASAGTGSGSLTPTVAGTYYWIASYSGNPPNTSGPVAGGCGDSGEVSIVGPNTPGIITVASAAPPTGVALGSAINDVATMSGLAAPSNGVHGTITFNAYGPFNNTTTCTGTPVYTSTITISGNGSYNSANGSGGTFTPTAAGNYNWIASYQPGAGDVNNVAVSGQCGDANEGSLIKTLTPGVSTSQFFFPNDSATITVVSGGGNLAGTVRFRVWTNNTCTGTPLYDSGLLNVANGTGSGTSRTLETTNTTNRVSVALNGNPIRVYWQVDFDSSNPGHVDVLGSCGMESSVITVTDLPPAGGGGN